MGLVDFVLASMMSASLLLSSFTKSELRTVGADFFEDTLEHCNHRLIKISPDVERRSTPRGHE